MPPRRPSNSASPGCTSGGPPSDRSEQIVEILLDRRRDSEAILGEGPQQVQRRSPSHQPVEKIVRMNHPDMAVFMMGKIGIGRDGERRETVGPIAVPGTPRSEEQTSEPQSLMRNSYA